MSVRAAQFPAQVWDGTSAQRPDRNRDAWCEAKDFDQLAAEVIAAQTAILNGAFADAALGVPNGTGVALTSSVAGDVITQLLTLTNVAISIASAADGFGSLKILDPPAGNILILGASGSLTLTTVGADIDADAAVVASVGSVACADDATLTSTEANIIPSTAFTLVASTKTAVVNSTAPVTLLNPDVYLNIAVPDADRTDTAQDITVTGTIKISYINLS